MKQSLRIALNLPGRPMLATPDRQLFADLRAAITTAGHELDKRTDSRDRDVRYTRERMQASRLANVTARNV